jgi:hypothetical protein
VAAGDIDGDGLPDVMVADQSSSISGISRVSVFRNKSIAGSMTFAPKIDLTTGIRTKGIALGDLNKDGKTDIAATNTGSNTVSVFINTSTPGVVSFAARMDFATGVSPQSVILTDLDGDGLLEVVVNNVFDASSISVLKNSSTGPANTTFLPAQNIQLLYGGDGFLTTGDLNGDGKPELVTTNAYSSNTLSILKNTSTVGTISFAAEQSFSTVIEPMFVAINDLDGDGKPDLALTSGTYGSSLAVYKNNSTAGNILFDPYMAYAFPGNAFFGLVLGDIDGDHKPDVVVSNTQATISVFKNQSHLFSLTRVCMGAGTTIVSDVSGTAYQWQVNAGTGFTNLTNNSIYTNVTGQSLQISNVPLTFNNYQYRCFVNLTYSKIAVLSVTAQLPNTTITAFGPTNFCQGANVILSSSAPSGNQWCLNAVPIGGAIAQTYTAMGAGAYSVITTNECFSGTSNSINVLVTAGPSAPVITASPSATLCESSTVTLSANASGCAACTYVWSNGSTGQNTTTNAGGNYTVTVTNGCGTASASQLVAINLKPNVLLNLQDIIICAGSSVTIVATGAANYVWNPSIGLSSNSSGTVIASPAVTTTYMVTGTTNGCSASKNITVTVAPLSTPSITISDSACTSNSILFSAQIGNGGSNFTIRWYVNNGLAGAGQTFHLLNPVNGMKVHAELTSPTFCPSSLSIVSASSTVSCILINPPSIDGVEVFEVGPNPSTGFIQVSLKLIQPKRVSFAVFDLAGIKVYQTNPVNRIGTVIRQIDLRGKPSGIFYLKTTIGDSTVTNKIMIVR